MDYDDNDFQSQNFRLAGEENIKFPPGLRSYALPKFDLDDSLQVHLRFDSLVETEALLGIQSQEQNQWIEEFSRGSSRIEFSSGAAESCSISRHNNVWSEATSSESVELLLNSVGQDEIIMEETIIEESVVCDELGSLTNEMEPSLRQDGSILSKIGDVVDSGRTLPSEKCLESLSGLNKDVVMGLSQVEPTSQTHEGKKPGHESSRDFDPCSVREKCGLPVTERSIIIDGKCTDTNQREGGPLVDGSLDNRTGNDPTTLKQVDNLATSMQNIIASVGELNSQGSPPQVTDIAYENADALQKVDDEKWMEHQVLNKEAQADVQNCEGNAVESKINSEENTSTMSMDSKVQIAEGNVVETSINNVENPFSLALSMDSAVMQIAEGCSEDVCSINPIPISDCEVVASSKDTEIDDQLIGNTHEASVVVVEGDNSYDRHTVEIGNTNAGIGTSQELKMDSVAQITNDQSNVISFEKQEDLLESDGHQLESGISVSNSEMSLLTLEDNKLFAGDFDRSKNSNVGDLSSLTVNVCSSANLLCETQAIGNVKDGHDCLGVQVDHFNAKDHISSSMQVESMQACEKNVVVGQSDIHNSKQDVFVLEKGNACLHIDSGNMDCEKRTASSSLGQSTAEIEVIAHESSSYQIVGDEPVSTVVLEDPNVASCNTSDGVHLLSANGVATDVVMEHKEDGKSPFLVGDSTHSDKKEETVTKFSTEPSSLALKDFSQLESVPIPVSEFEQGAIRDNAGQGICETVGQPSSPKVTVSISFQNEPQEVVANKATLEHSKELEVGPVLHDSTVKENDDAEVVGVALENYEETSLRIAGTMPSKGERLPQPLPSSVEESSCDIGQKYQEGNEANLVSRDNNSRQSVVASTDDTLNGCEGATRPASLSECNAEFDAPEAGSRSPNSDEPNCGSPTIISCSQLSQSEKENPEGGQGSLDQNAPVSDAIDRVDNTVGCIPHDPKRNDASEDDRSFTFEVSSMADLSEKENDKGWKPFSSIQACEFPQTVEGSASTTSGLCVMDPKMVQEIPRESPRASDGENVCGSSRGPSERKTRRMSNKAADKETSKERKLLKEITSVRQMAERGAKSCNVSLSSLGTISQVVQAKDVRPYGYIEGSSTKFCTVPTVQTSNLPDLNTSASTSALFQQPFTDLQQVQLRAQIFVYGSLIQGTAPDEACMISAFGESDGGRSVWDSIWRVAVERLHNQKSPLSNPETPQQSRLGTLHNQKSPLSNPETPQQSRSGARAPEQATRQSALQTIALPSPVGRVGSKSTPSAIISPVIPLSSPLWSMSTPRDGLQSGSMPRGPFLDSHQALSPLQPYQSPHIRNYVGHTTPWLSQLPCPRPWIVSPQTSALDAGAHYSALPITEAVHVTSVRESFVPRPSGMKNAPPSPLVHSGVPTSVFTGTAPLLEAKKAVSPAKHASVDTKSRKRKKSPSEELGQICSLAQAQTEPILAPDVTTHLSTSNAITINGSSAPKSTPGNFIADISPMSSTHYQIIGGRDTEQRLVFLEEMCSKVEQAKLHAEDATALAAAAVRHSQGIWSQLADQKNSGLVSDVEAKLASAAVAVAAAASVAKAAAAAAKVASDAALQAKLMADEALVSSRTGNLIQSTETSLSDDMNNLGRVTSASILKGKDRTNSSSSIIVAAREAAKRRIEAASAATKRAENLNAVVKAAELAAEAITQAGTVIAMGDPLPLTMSELVEAGPEGYWKVQQVSSDLLVKSNDKNKGEQTSIDGVGEGPYAKHFNKQPSNKKAQTIYQGKPSSSKEMSRESVEDHMGLVKGMLWDSVTSTEKGSGGQKGSKVSDSAKTIGVVPESEIGSEFASITVQNEDYEGHQPVGTSKENSIREGSLVEVLSEEDGLRRVWFSAKVLSLKDEKAYVCYTELLPNEDSGKLEWVALNGEGENAPRVRIARPMTTMKFEGTRKRRREATGDYAWSVGDRVDAWIRDGWWEGIITEKNKEDETTLTIQFPDQEDTSIVRAWHLRPSLVWKDGQWMQWSSPRENNCYPHEGDTPQEKRLKLVSHGDVDSAVKTRGKEKMSNSIAIEESGKPEESRSLALSAKEKMFNVGKNTREENTSNALRTKRIGLQKEGPRVIFGVPKPGKKRKFMEVSKHYVADRGGKINEGNDPIKFAKYLIPQGSGSRGWKNTSKVVSKEKRAAESKSKVLRSGKPPSVPSRSLPQKDNSLTSAVSNDGSARDRLPNVKASVSHDENTSGKQNLIDSGPSTNTHKAAEGPVLFSLLALPTDGTSSEKKSSSAVEPGWVNKGKLAPSGAKLAIIEEKDTAQNDYPGKSIPGGVEPRRSNRRIQPTSRLLEGLQSSLIISKIPTVSHDKGTKAQHRSALSSRGNNHR